MPPTRTVSSCPDGQGVELVAERFEQLDEHLVRLDRELLEAVEGRALVERQDGQQQVVGGDRLVVLQLRADLARPREGFLDQRVEALGGPGLRLAWQLLEMVA